MRAKNTLIIMAGLLVLTLPSLLRAQVPAPPKTPDVSGIWVMTMQTPQGEMAMDATFTQDKEAIKVSMMSPMGTEMKGEGTIKEQELQWTMAISTPNGEFSLGFKAKLDGDTMTGEVQMGDFGSSTFSAIKKK
jgi:xanthosine utilization system XapX-like protein